MATAKIIRNYIGNYPTNYPTYMSGKLTYKVKPKKDYVRADGTCALYVQVFLNGKKMLPLDIAVRLKDFDEIKQRVRAAHQNAKDFNLLIEKKLADINTIEVNYRLAGKILSLENLTEDLNNPTARVDFIKFWTDEMARQKDILKSTTYRQQMTMLNKVENYKSPLFFYEINQDYIKGLKAHCKSKLKNNDSTIASLIKSFKKYLHIANQKGISTPISFSEIKNKTFKGNRTFLEVTELQKLHEYWNSQFINETHKNMLSIFLFSCFTGLRFSDVTKLKAENIMENFVVFTAEKTGKFQRVPINKTAQKFINPGTIFNEIYTNEYFNRELKNIAKICGIRKVLSFHVSRHTFATNFLVCGGRVEHLQKLLGHYKIEETMIYVHIVENLTNLQVFDMDKILK